MPDTLRRCRQGSRCIDALPYVPEDPDEPSSPRLVGSRVADLGPDLCDPCSRAAWWSLHDSPARVRELEELLADPLRAPGSNVDPSMPRSTYRERPVELNLNADALLRELVHEACVWAEALDDELESRDPERTLSQRWEELNAGTRFAPRMLAAADLMLAFWDDLIALPARSYRTHGSRPRVADTLLEHTVDELGLTVTRDGVSAACTFLAIAHAADVEAGRGPSRVERQHEPCPHCGAPGAVVRTPPLHVGAPAPLKCEQCHRGISEDRWDAWAMLDTAVDDARLGSVTWATPTPAQPSPEPPRALRPHQARAGAA